MLVLILIRVPISYRAVLFVIIWPANWTHNKSSSQGHGEELDAVTLQFYTSFSSPFVHKLPSLGEVKLFSLKFQRE